MSIFSISTGNFDANGPLIKESGEKDKMFAEGLGYVFEVLHKIILKGREASAMWEY